MTQPVDHGSLKLLPRQWQTKDAFATVVATISLSSPATGFTCGYTRPPLWGEEVVFYRACRESFFTPAKNVSDTGIHHVCLFSPSALHSHRGCEAFEITDAAHVLGQAENHYSHDENMKNS